MIPFWSVPLTPLLKSLRRFYSNNQWILIAFESQREYTSIFPFFNQVISLPPIDPISIKEWTDFFQRFQPIASSIFFSLNPFDVELSELLASYSAAEIRINPFEYRNPTYHNLSLHAQEVKPENLIQSLETRINTIYHHQLQLEPLCYPFPREIAKEAARFLISLGYQTHQPLIVLNLQPDYEDMIPAFSQILPVLNLIPDDHDPFIVVFCNDPSLQETISRKYPRWKILTETPLWQSLAIIILSELFITTVDDRFSLSALFRRHSLVIARSRSQMNQCQARQFQNHYFVNLSDLPHPITEVRQYILQQIHHPANS